MSLPNIYFLCYRVPMNTTLSAVVPKRVDAHVKNSKLYRKQKLRTAASKLGNISKLFVCPLLVWNVYTRRTRFAARGTNYSTTAENIVNDTIWHVHTLWKNEKKVDYKCTIAHGPQKRRKYWNGENPYDTKTTCHVSGGNFQ